MDEEDTIRAFENRRQKRKDLKRRIKYLEGQMLYEQSYVVYWSNRGSSAEGSSAVSTWDNNKCGRDSFKTALRHIHLIEELNDSRDKLIRELNEIELSCE